MPYTPSYSVSENTICIPPHLFKQKNPLGLNNFPQVFLGNQILGKLMNLVEANGVDG